MGCHGDRCEAVNVVRLLNASPQQKLRVELWLRGFYDQAVHEGQYDVAAGVMVELKRMSQNGNSES